MAESVRGNLSESSKAKAYSKHNSSLERVGSRVQHIFGGSLRVPAIGGRQMSRPNYSVTVMMMMATIIN